MKQNIILVVLLTASLAATGCRTFTSPARHKPLGQSSKVEWMDFDASRRGGFLIQTNTPFQLILEPAPDVAITSVAEFITKASVKDKFTAEQTTKITESLTSLGERTEAVMVLRESLFRLNLLAANGTVDKNDVTNLFSQILNVASKIADAEVNKQKTKEEQAKTDAKQADADKSKSDANAKATDLKTELLKSDLFKSKISAIQKLDIAPDKKANMIESLNQADK